MFMLRYRKCYDISHVILLYNTLFVCYVMLRYITYVMYVI